MSTWKDRGISHNDVECPLGTVAGCQSNGAGMGKLCACPASDDGSEEPVEGLFLSSRDAEVERKPSCSEGLGAQGKAGCTDASAIFADSVSESNKVEAAVP